MQHKTSGPPLLQCSVVCAEASRLIASASPLRGVFQVPISIIVILVLVLVILDRLENLRKFIQFGHSSTFN